MSRLENHGIAVELPAGWEGRIGVRDTEEVGAAAAGETTGALVHAANFALPASGGDFGSGAVELMRTGDLLVILFEYDRVSATQPLFAARGVPTLVPADFSPATLQRTLDGQSGTQRFFNEAGRAFCLYVVLGSHLRRFGAVPEVNAVLRTVTIT